MSAQSPKSYFLSGLVHAGVVAVLMVMAWVMQKPQRAPTQVLDLVAGEGDNWSATEAPALGSPTGSEAIKVPNFPPMPKIEQPAPEPEPPAVQQAPPVEQAPVVEPAPSPKVTRAPEKAPAKPAVAHDPLDRKNFVKDIKRLSTKRERRLLEAYHRRLALEEKRRLAEEKRRMTEEEFRKLHGGKASPSGHFRKIDAKGIAGGVEGGSTANTKGGAGGHALSVAEQRLMDQYFAFLKQRLREAQVPPPGVSDKLTATVEFFLAADGTISNIRVITTSGNSEFDQSVVQAFRTVHSIGPRPDGQSDELQLDFNTKQEE